MKKYCISLSEAIGLLKGHSLIGCIYPNEGESYYIDSNIQEPMCYISCMDGGLFCTWCDVLDRIPTWNSTIYNKLGDSMLAMYREYCYWSEYFTQLELDRDIERMEDYGI